MRGILHVLWAHPAMLVAWLALTNAATYGFYAWDKRQAKRGGWRVKESTLLILALAGGTPAAMLAARLLRHKNRKASFRLRLGLIMMVQVLGLAYFFVVA